MDAPNFCLFPLRSDFHLEVGWRAFVRDQALENELVVRTIIENRGKFDLGHDPRSLIERWEPYTVGIMVYFWMIRAGQFAPSFVATDGVFTMFVDPRPRDEHLAGLASDLLEAVNSAVTKSGISSIEPSPILPPHVGIRRAFSNSFPDQLVVHRYQDGFAYLRPCIPTLRTIDADPATWVDREPKVELPRST